MVEIDADKCKDCSICTEICPNFVFVSQNDRMQGGVIAANPDLCCGCGHCVLYCPHNAIRHQGISDEAISHERKPDIQVPDLTALMMGRRSVRSFKPDGVPKSQIDSLVEIGVNAGSASNMQSESFLIVRNQEILGRLEEIGPVCSSRQPKWTAKKSTLSCKWTTPSRYTVL